MISHSKIIVRYAETDKMAIVHHSNYPIWFEVARTDYIKIWEFTTESLKTEVSCCRL